MPVRQRRGIGGGGQLGSRDGSAARCHRTPGQRCTTTTRTFPSVAAGRLSVAVLRSVTLALHGGGVAAALTLAGHAHATSFPLALPERRSVTFGPEAFVLLLAAAAARATGTDSVATASVLPRALRSCV